MAPQPLRDRALRYPPCSTQLDGLWGPCQPWGAVIKPQGCSLVSSTLLFPLLSVCSAFLSGSHR